MEEWKYIYIEKICLKYLKFRYIVWKIILLDH